MFPQTQKDILYYLRRARAALFGIMDRSPAEVCALNELEELIVHIQAIEARVSPEAP